MSEQSVLNAIRELGPMGTTELAQHLDLHRQTVVQTMRRLRDKKRVYISGYQRQDGGGRGWYTVLYSIGNKQDRPKPKGLTPTERSRRYRERNKAIIALRRAKVKTQATPWTGLGARSGQ